MDTRDTEHLVEALTSNWQTEMRGYHTYNALSLQAIDPQQCRSLHALALAEQHHADLWASRLTALGASVPEYTGSEGGEADSLSNRIGGLDLALRRLELDESRDIAHYGKQIEDLGDEPTIAILKTVLEDEREHYITLGNLIRRVLPPSKLEPAQAKRALDDLMAARDKGKSRSASWIGDAIYGVNDGLGAIFGIVSGVAGATEASPSGAHYVLIAGLAGMIASALSMGSGAYLAAKSEREAVEYNESEARELLSLTYQVRGLTAEDADHFVGHIAEKKEQLVEVLARERLHISEEGLSKPWVSATSGALSTAVGAFIPVIPFFFMSGIPAIVVAAIISLIAHFAVGASKSLVTIRSWWASGLEMTAIGAIEGVVTYIIGIGIGHLAGS